MWWRKGSGWGGCGEGDGGSVEERGSRAVFSHLGGPDPTWDQLADMQMGLLEIIRYLGYLMVHFFL